MKKTLIFSAILMYLCCPMEAQTSKGTFAIGLHNFAPPSWEELIAPTTSFGIAFGEKTLHPVNGSNKSSYSYLTIGLNGNARYFLFNHFAVGINFDYLSQSYNQTLNGDYDSSLKMYFVGPELSYFIPVHEKISIWTKGSASWGSLNLNYDGKVQKPHHNSQFGGGAGLAYFPNPHVSIDLGCGYYYFTNNYNAQYAPFPKVEETYSSLSIGFGFTFFL